MKTLLKKTTAPKKVTAVKKAPATAKSTARVFWYHYNKPASQKAKKPQITVHFGGKCHIVDSIECAVPTAGHKRSTQPHFVVKGTGRMSIKKNIAYITK